MNFLQEVTQGIVTHSKKEEVAALVKKWEKYGLLEGLEDTRRSPNKSNMAMLLENQAKQFLTEASTVGNITGFQNVAFPIIRRVFGGLLANELVSVQPMSLPSGLLFYLDYRFATVKGGDRNDDFTVGASVFGDRNTLQDAKGTGGMYNYQNSFSQREKVSVATFSGTIAAATLADVQYEPALSGNLTNVNKLTLKSAFLMVSASGSLSDLTGLKNWVPCSGSSTSAAASTDGTPVQMGTPVFYRRFTTQSGNDTVFVYSGSLTGVESVKVVFPVASTLTGGTSGTLLIPSFESDMNSPPTPSIPEIDLRIQSVSVDTQTRKLRARWTPELAQDLAAYQNVDAEVELTQVLSEIIALEIDREVISDLLFNATGANYYWSRKPGNFVVKDTGNTATGASFTGTVREWYETFIETIIDVANAIHTKTLRGAANFCVVSPAVSTILEASVLYKPVLSMDPKETMYTVGTEKVGSLANRFTVYKDPYMIVNKVLVGFKGSSFLETGYVYAPYVPLIVTPVIYKFDDYTPSKGVMTRYARKVTRSDFYGTVTVQDLSVI